MEKQPTFLDLARHSREKFRGNLHQPVPADLCAAMVEGIDPEASVLLFDAGCVLAFTLLNQGHNAAKIYVWEDKKNGATYFDFARAAAKQFGFNFLTNEFNNRRRIGMKFDVIIGNPPYQAQNGGGDKRGSTTNPLWYQFTNDALYLLKEGGLLSFVTPTGMFEGGSHFTAPFLGAERKYDLKTVDFSADDAFKVGIDICRWTATNTKTEGNTCTVNDGRVVDTDTAFKVTRDAVFSGILNTVFAYGGDKLNFNQSGSYDYRPVARELARQGLPTEWAKDLKVDSDETYKFPVNINGTIKYSRVEWKNRGTWRLFIAKMKKLSVDISKEWEADGSTFTMAFDTEEAALLTQGYLSDPRYAWVIEQTRLNGRLNGTTICALPNAPIEEVLSAEQLSYIESQL